MVRGLYTGKILALNFNLSYHNGAPVADIFKSKSTGSAGLGEGGVVTTKF